MKIALISLFCLLISCDQIGCTNDVLSDKDENSIEKINSEFISFKIYPDNCLAHGYFNVQLNSSEPVDTLQLQKVLDRSFEFEIKPKIIQVYDANGYFLFFMKKVDEGYFTWNLGDI